MSYNIKRATIHPHAKDTWLFCRFPADIIYGFDIAWVGWECDHHGYIAKDIDNKVCLIITNHGAYKKESIDFLFFKIKEYSDLIEQTNKAIELLGEK